MAAIENEKIYGVTIRESADDGSDFTNPDADYRRLFLGEDGFLHVKNSAGAVTDPYEVATGSAVIARKTADEVVNNSATLQNDDHLLLALAANEVWEVEINLWYDSGTTPDLKVGFTVPAGATFRWSLTGLDGAGSSQSDNNTMDASATANVLGNGVGTIRHTRIKGFVVNGATPGNLQLQWAQNTANASDTTVRTNSAMKAWKLA